MEFNPVLLKTDNRKIKIITLENNINIMYIKDNVKSSLCSVCIGSGYLSDEFDGTAHFLEHLLFMGSKKFPDRTEYHSYIQEHNGEDNAFTSYNITFYYLLLDNKYFEKGVEMLSWFFREPILDEKYIKSESEIIDAEHKKNILQDQWVMDDLLKKFMKNKYNKFGTGCLESLEGIKREDINKFYRDYYTTDNMNVCIVDNIEIEEMEKKYTKYFSEIKKSKKSEERDEKIELREENIITFKSTSEYKLLNIYMILDVNKNSVLDVQIINFLIYIIGCEYENSFGYYIKRQNIVNNYNIRMDYMYDEECIITISFRNNIEEYKIIKEILEKYIEYIINIDDSIMSKLWNNYRNIMLLQEINNPRSDLTDMASYYLDNINKYGKERAIDVKYNIEEYRRDMIERIKKILKSNRMKIIKNFGSKKYSKKSEYYNIEYNIEKEDEKSKIKHIKFEIEKMIGIKDFKSDKYNREINNNNDNKEDESKIKKIRENIYKIEDKRFDLDKSKFVLIRRNNLVLELRNIMIFSLYNDIINKLMINYIEVMNMYEMYYSMNIVNNNIIYEFSGLDEYLMEYVEKILKRIRENNRLIVNEYENVKREYIEYYENIRYNMPFELCNKYLTYIYKYENFMPKDKIKYLNNLSFEKFKMELSKIFNFDEEYLILYGKTFDENENIDKIERYIKNVNKKSEIKYNYKNNIIRRYKLKEEEKNEKETNNCIIFNYYVKEIENKDKDYKEIYKNILLSIIISTLIKEPLFDNIRTINKMGYIAKCFNKVYENNDKTHIIINYVIQSRYKIEKIFEKVESFNKEFLNNLNNKEIDEKILQIKDSLINLFNKPDNNVNLVIGNYIDKLICYYLDKNRDLNINMNNIKINILKEIQISEIKNTIIQILNSEFGYVLSEKNKNI